MKSILQKLKTLIKITIGREVFLRPEIFLPKIGVGLGYGGWDISPEGISSHSVMYSFGVGEDISFDLDLIERFGVIVHAFDPTPRSIRWIEQKKNLPVQFIMHPYGIASFEGDAVFYPPERSDHVSHTLLYNAATYEQAITLPVKRLTTIMKQLGHTHINILKMDIEGAEYDVIADIMASDIRPRQILIEFHHAFPSVELDKTLNAIATLRSMGYVLFSVSNTNAECSFIFSPDI